MSNFDLIIMALGNLFRRKMRTLLTVLGVVIGTTSILVMISIGLGLERKFDQELKQFGSLTKITVYPSGHRDGGGMIYDDEFVNKIQMIEHVDTVVPMICIRGGLFSGKTEGYGELFAFDFKYLKELGIELQDGRMPEVGEVLVGKQVLEEFWDYGKQKPKQVKIDPFKDTLEVKIQPKGGAEGAEKRKGMKLKVVGVMGNEDWDIATAVYIDINEYQDFIKKYNKKYKVKKLTAKERKNQSKYQNVFIFVDDVKNMETVSETLREMEIEFFAPGEWIEQAKGEAKMIQNVLGAIGGVSLIVAAIGITNTMVMSIYERTKEIGVMKVIGAKVGDIRRLFLIEAAFIGFFGGVMGVGLSYAFSNTINYMAEKAKQDPDGMGIMVEMFSDSYLPIQLALMGVIFAMLIGILAGLYPSIRATRISALDAIRTD